jgi:hypothetical protein
MNILIKLHIGLFKYLIKELPKKKTLKEKIEFLKPIPKSYIKEILRLIKSLFLIFDKEYRKKKKEFNKLQKLRIDLDRSLKILRYIDDKMIKQGKNRQEIRQFWLDFTKHGQLRKDVLDEVTKEINQIGR